MKANGRLGYSVRDVRSRAALATALLALLLSLAASAYAQDDAGMAAQQAAQQAMQATQQALQDMQLATQMATQQALQANDQAMQQAMQNAALASTPSPLPRAAKPHFSPAAGKFASATLVSIQDGTPKAEIFYTLDGTEPTVFSDPYNGPILISSTIRLKAIARSPIYSPSRVASAKYVIK